MATFIGTGVSETITPAFVSAGVTRIPAGSVPGAAADVILARGGNDVTDGGGGNDVIDAGDGNDSLRGNTGADVLIGGTGTDTATYTESVAGVSVNLLTGTGSGGSATGDTLFDIENLTGSSFADTLTGNTGANTLNGGSGNDVLTGGFGADTMTGGVGFDTFDFNFSGESPPVAGNHDHITDFVGNGVFAGDVIDLATIDANTSFLAPGNQAFLWSGAVAAANSVWYNAALDLLQGDTNGNAATVEFEVHFLNNPTVTQFDVIL